MAGTMISKDGFNYNVRGDADSTHIQAYSFPDVVAAIKQMIEQGYQPCVGDDVKTFPQVVGRTYVVYFEKSSNKINTPEPTKVDTEPYVEATEDEVASMTPEDWESLDAMMRKKEIKEFAASKGIQIDEAPVKKMKTEFEKLWNER